HSPGGRITPGEHGGATRPRIDVVRVLVTVGRVGTVHAAVVAEQRLIDIALCGLEVPGEDARAVTDVGVHVLEARLAWLPLPAMERHHLHEANRTDRAPDRRIDPRVLDEQYGEQQARL